ncbi:ZIP family metal transporter [Crocinitomix catalasitica]|uniref:ZIP family metal transporter n=1 Tax=Crocinitomix catalasitica TaxID=184607 RepID=UPI00055E2F78|nr:ZIP family metal transporter [Crocinitomix catalasitica]
MEIVEQLITLIGSVIIGGLLVSILKKSTNIKLLLSFSGGFLLTIIFTHILPDSYTSFPNTGIFILIGFLLQLILEYFSKGAEHGHTHIHSNEILKHFPIAIFLSLCLHAFLEAIPLNHGGHHHVDNLFWGVFLHKIPVAVALKTILDVSGMSKKASWFYLLVFALMAPLGLVLGEWLATAVNMSLNWLLSIAIGMFFHVATTIIFESSEGHKINFLKLVAIIAGFAVGLLM